MSCSSLRIARSLWFPPGSLRIPSDPSGSLRFPSAPFPCPYLLFWDWLGVETYRRIDRHENDLGEAIPFVTEEARRLAIKGLSFSRLETIQKPNINSVSFWKLVLIMTWFQKGCYVLYRAFKWNNAYSTNNLQFDKMLIRLTMGKKYTIRHLHCLISYLQLLKSLKRLKYKDAPRFLGSTGRFEV